MMAKSQDDYVAEKIDPAEPVPASDINEPPPPVKVTDEKLANIHAVLAQIVTALEVMAVQSAAGHSLASHFAGIKDSLAALFDRAHSK